MPATRISSRLDHDHSNGSYNFACIQEADSAQEEDPRVSLKKRQSEKLRPDYFEPTCDPEEGDFNDYNDVDSD